ncbi:MAG: cation:proton antiporter [Gammaproteobacteria bacterium]|nr:cation:proton antiporter [Gammaproteobacteria bacterium]MYF38172.1 cation:proton antiporter [Gammaproteobacteria bacterium]
MPQLLQTMMLIFALTAVAASVGMFARQPLIIVYIVLGCVLGPHALGWIGESHAIEELGHIGIIFLLFIVGLDLPTKRIKNVFRQSILTVLVSSVVFFGLGFGLGFLLGFESREAMITALAFLFSSTIVGVKLVPRTALHHRRIGELVIGLLILQDILAVLALLYVSSSGETISLLAWLKVFGIPPLIVLGAILCAKFVFWPLMQKFDVVTEYTFLMFLGWCMGIAFCAHALGVTFEIGAFIAGVALANSSAAQLVASTLEPLQDFFLVLFFFYVGTTVDPILLWSVAWQVGLLALACVLIKPLVFRYLIGWLGEDRKTSWEVGYRLGQNSEFSLLILYVAATQMSDRASLIVLGATVLTLLISSYVVVFNFKNPIALSDHLRVN